jgi:hypothetical protein
MIIKLAIIGAVVLIGGITFASEFQELFPNTTSTGVNSLKSDVSALAKESIQTAEQTIDSSVEKAETKLTDFGHQTIETAERTIDSSVEKAETKFSEIKQNSTNYVEENIVDKIPFLNEEDKS